ncbi:hypothetical protein [Nannocystis radixulma]|uniref:Uncharacterized protein n=1 Tax=Nannocystis radixulma TaxID=2995305 RepID=A0ABT5BEQ3_9BACT|nr:hypothetical protein [Nannocystis radixulma]MDC0672552.1 hypothetical protein [Nannocystis radixulma]
MPISQPAPPTASALPRPSSTHQAVVPRARVPVIPAATTPKPAPSRPAPAAVVWIRGVMVLGALGSVAGAVGAVAVRPIAHCAGDRQRQAGGEQRDRDEREAEEGRRCACGRSEVGRRAPRDVWLEGQVDALQLGVADVDDAAQRMIPGGAGLELPCAGAQAQLADGRARGAADGRLLVGEVPRADAEEPAAGSGDEREADGAVGAVGHEVPRDRLRDAVDADGEGARVRQIAGRLGREQVFAGRQLEGQRRRVVVGGGRPRELVHDELAIAGAPHGDTHAHAPRQRRADDELERGADGQLGCGLRLHALDRAVQRRRWFMGEGHLRRAPERNDERPTRVDELHAPRQGGQGLPRRSMAIHRRERCPWAGHDTSNVSSPSPRASSDHGSGCSPTACSADLVPIVAALRRRGARYA